MARNESLPFHSGAVFVAARDFTCQGKRVHRGDVFPWRRFSLAVRKVRRLFEAHWIQYADSGKFIEDPEPVGELIVDPDPEPEAASEPEAEPTPEPEPEAEAEVEAAVEEPEPEPKRKSAKK